MDDKTIQFRLKHRFPLLPDALGKSPTSFPAMMPMHMRFERAAVPLIEQRDAWSIG